jgi:hypothetical protein
MVVRWSVEGRREAVLGVVGDCHSEALFCASWLDTPCPFFPFPPEQQQRPYSITYRQGMR